MHSGILSKPLWIDLACSPPWRHSGRTGMFTREQTRSCLASGRTVSLSASISFHTLPSLSLRTPGKGHWLLPRAISFTERALPLGEWQVQSIHQRPVCKREAFSHSARESLAFLIISGALGVDLHHRQDPIWTQDLPEQSSDKWNPLWWHFFLPTPSFISSFPYRAFSIHLFPDEQGLKTCPG